MDKYIQQIWILTLLFTLCGGLLLIFRRIDVGGSGRTLKRLWTVVLILAILPLHLLPVTLPRKGRMQTNLIEQLTVKESVLVERLSQQLDDATADSLAPQVGDAENDMEPKEEATETVTAVEEQGGSRAERLVKSLEGLVLAIWCCGVIGFLIKYQHAKRRAQRGLRRCSRPCEEASWNRLLQSCAERVGIHRQVMLCVVDESLPPMSPCLVGLRRPRLYIHASHLNDSLEVEEIFAHELQHLRSWDAFYKQIACGVMAIHWFNPITYLIWPRLLEDCELSCDSRTLEVLGEERRISYMKTILNIAATTQQTGKAGKAASYFCEPSGKQTLRRRYRNVTRRRQQPVWRILALCLAAVMVFACVGCQLIGKQKSTLHLLTPLTEEMVRFYYDLSPEDEITQEMLDGVTSLFIYRDMNVINGVKEAEREGYVPDATGQYPFEGQRYTINELSELTILNFEVNYADTEDSFAAFRNQGDPVNIVGCMNYFPQKYMESVVFETIKTGFSDGYVNTATGAHYDADFVYKQFKAFFCLKDISLVTSERQIEEMKQVWPGLENQPPFYILDSTADDNLELMRIYILMAHVGLLDNRILADGELDTDIFKVFPNLTDLHIVGLNEK